MFLKKSTPPLFYSKDRNQSPTYDQDEWIFNYMKTGERMKVCVCCPQSNLSLIFIRQNILWSTYCKYEQKYCL